MTLAMMARGRRLEMQADFQQYYGLDYRGISARRAADLAVMLPHESRTMKKINPECAWTDAERLLSRIEYWLHVIVWRESEDARARRNCPEMITPRRGDGANAQYAAPVDEYAARLARPRKEVPSGDRASKRVPDPHPIA